MATLYKRKKKNSITYYLQYIRPDGKRISEDLKTDSYQIAKEVKRQFESAQFRGDYHFLPTRTPVGKIVGEYVRHMRQIKTAKSAQSDLYNLREAFGAICDELADTRRRTDSPMPSRPRRVKRNNDPVIIAKHLEEITTADVSTYIAQKVQLRGLSATTANRYREVLHTLFNWAMEERGVRMPGGGNPVAKVKRYKQRQKPICFLTLQQIDEQLTALASHRQLQVMTALLIYAGLRREEVVWLRWNDIEFNAGEYGMIRVRAKRIDGRSWQPKTGKDRAVPISGTLRYYLDQYGSPKRNAGWYFPSPQGVWWDADNFSKALAKANKRGGLSWSCLDFRHTFGSQLAASGISLYKIATLLGNSPEICRRHYAALIPEELADCVEFRSGEPGENHPRPPTLQLVQTKGKTKNKKVLTAG